MSRPLNADAALCEKSLSVSLCLTFYFSARSLPGRGGAGGAGGVGEPEHPTSNIERPTSNGEGAGGAGLL